MVSKNSKIFVTGHKGLVGNAIVKKLKIKWRQYNILVEMKLLEKKFISIVLKIRT